MWRMLPPLLAVLLAACAGDPPRAPVEDRNAPRPPVADRQTPLPPAAGRHTSGPPVEDLNTPRPPIEERPTPTPPRQHPAISEAKRDPPPVIDVPLRSYTVVNGDTMYSIAWRYGFDYRALAGANRIASPYRIYPGQTLKLTDKASSSAAAVPAPSVARTPAQVVKKAAPVQSTADTTTAKATVTNSSRSGGTKKPAAVESEQLPASGPIRWRWPTKGKVVRVFSGTVHKGIDIDGNAGDEILAVANGRVVYSGSGIVGYGKLLIVKHNDIYLSAYGHNSELLVAEGASVKAGQKIAEKGSSATNAVKLHFEIRQEGKPVDPKKLLPTP